MLTLSEVVFDLAFVLPLFSVVLGAIALAVTRRAARSSASPAPEVAVH